MAAGDVAKAGLSADRLGRLRAGMAGYVERGEIPGIVTAIRRRGETFVDAHGKLAAGGRAPSSATPSFGSPRSASRSSRLAR